jgi:hypothetical protein
MHQKTEGKFETDGIDRQTVDDGQAFGWTDRQTVWWWTDRLSGTDRHSGEQTDSQETSINRQTIRRWTDLQMMDRPYIILSTDRPLGNGLLGDGQTYKWRTDRTLYYQQTDCWAMDRSTVNRQTVGCTRTSLISQKWHLSSAKKRFITDKENKLTPFFCQKKILSWQGKCIKKRRKINLG